MKVLLVEDDLSLCQGIALALNNEGFLVEKAFRGEQALLACDIFLPDIVILDLGLPDMDGKEVLSAIRKRHKKLPVLILTARTATEEKVNTLDSGADDYLSKPFEMPELLARLRVLGRRLGTSESSVIEISNVQLDLASHTITVDGIEKKLSRREYAILKSLMENAGRIQTKESLESRLYHWDADIASNTIEVHISNLRKKIPKQLIKTIRGVGYLIPKENEGS